MTKSLGRDAVGAHGVTLGGVKPTGHQHQLRIELSGGGGIQSKCLTIVQAFRPKSENFDFGKTEYHRKGHLKRSRMAQNSAS